MAFKPEMAVFRRFSKLNALRLLELQSELLEQEQEYDYACKLDAVEDCPVTHSYQYNWKSLNDSGGKGGTCQRDKWAKLRERLDLYSEPGNRYRIPHKR